MSFLTPEPENGGSPSMLPRWFRLAPSTIAPESPFTVTCAPLAQGESVTICLISYWDHWLGSRTAQKSAAGKRVVTTNSAAGMFRESMNSSFPLNEYILNFE
jgi:hypothetical protein